MALDDKLYCIDKLKIFKNLKDLENCVATNKQTTCVVKPQLNVTYMCKSAFCVEVTAVPSWTAFIFLNYFLLMGRRIG